MLTVYPSVQHDWIRSSVIWRLQIAGLGPSSGLAHGFVIHRNDTGLRCCYDR